MARTTKKKTTKKLIKNAKRTTKDIIMYSVLLSVIMTIIIEAFILESLTPEMISIYSNIVESGQGAVLKFALFSSVPILLAVFCTSLFMEYVFSLNDAQKQK